MDFYLKLKDKFDEIREFIRDNDPDSEVFYMLCVGRFVETEEDSVALELSYSTDLDDIEELDDLHRSNHNGDQDDGYQLRDLDAPEDLPRRSAENLGCPELIGG